MWHSAMFAGCTTPQKLAYGSIEPDKEEYSTGETVTYNCDEDHYPKSQLGGELALRLM